MIARKQISLISSTNARAVNSTDEVESKDVNERAEAIAGWISLTLRFGVGLSLLLLIIGTTLTFYHHPEYNSQRASLIELTRPDAPFPHSVETLAAGLNGGQGQAIVTLGLLVLIATPILRVAISTLTFWHERDWPFTLITLTVLSLLMLSMVLGKVHG